MLEEQDEKGQRVGKLRLGRACLSYASRSSTRRELAFVHLAIHIDPDESHVA